MSTILFVTIDAGGNVPPAMAIAREMQARGHRIVFLAHPQQREAAEEAGFRFEAFTDARPWDHSKRSSTVRTISDYAHAATSKALSADCIAVARAQHVDLAVVDCMLPGIVSACRTSGVPCAVLFHSFYAFWTGMWAHGPIGRIAQFRGVDPRKAWARSGLELVASDPALDPAGGSAGHHRIWTGPAEATVAPQIRADERPRILVSLSTLWLPGQTDAYRRIFAALADLPVDAIVTTGGQAIPGDLPVPPNVEVVGFVDHAEILPTVDLVICHGGHSTTMRAVVNGIPVLVIPMHPMIDQRMIGAAIQKSGIGLTIKKKSEPATIANAVATLLGTPSYRVEAAKAAQRHQASGGISVAADALTALLASHAVTRSR